MDGALIDTGHASTSSFLPNWCGTQDLAVAFPWDVQEYEGNIYREDMDYVDDYTHDYDPVLVDSDYDQSFRGVSSPSYSHMTARKEIWKWLKTLRP